MADTVVATTPIKPAFEPAAYISEQNEKEAARRAGVAYVPKVAPAAAAVTEPPGPKPTRQDRRALNHAQQLLGAEKARREIAEAELAKLKNGSAPAPAAAAIVDEDPEPKRQSFTTDAEYTRAATAWDRRKEARDAAAKETETTANQKSLDALQAEIVAADTKAVEDQKLIPDWDEVRQAAEESDDQPEFTPAEHPYLMRMIATSDVKAFVLHHLALHPEDMEKLLDSTSDLVAQTNLFRRLEGRVEKLHSSAAAAAAKPAEKKAPAETEAERDAKKAKPSEAGAPKGGTAPAMELSPYLPDGKTMNPAWKERENQRAAARR